MTRLYVTDSVVTHERQLDFRALNFTTPVTPRTLLFEILILCPLLIPP